MSWYDRPVRPRWIYESLLLATPGQKMQDLIEPFEGIVTELTGKEGKIKVRTALFRVFLRDETNQAKVRSRLPLKTFSEQYGLALMAPIYLFYLMAVTDSMRFLAEWIAKLYPVGEVVQMGFLKTKMVGSFGDRDVVTRSVGAFLQTLEHFGIFELSGVEGKYRFKQKLKLEEDQLRMIFQLYTTEILRAPQLSIEQLPAWFYVFFDMPDVKQVAQKYNGVYWDYQHRVNAELLVVYQEK